MGEDLHRLQIVPVADWAPAAAELLARAIEESVDRRGRCLIALSGGSTPGPVFDELATRDLPWDRLIVVQADERIVAADDAGRNLAGQRAALGRRPVTWLPLPVDEILANAESGPGPLDEGRVGQVLTEFGRRLTEVADDPPIFDLVQLGLGIDGHTASLVPGDRALDELRAPVAITGPYDGTRRLTLTRPVLDRARVVVWLVAGGAKSAPLGRLLAGDLSIPAGLIRPRRSIIVADVDAARQP